MLPDRVDQLVPAAEAVPQTAGTRYVAQQLMEKRGFNPIDKMMDLAERLENHEIEECGNTPVHADKLFKIYNTLAKFYAPQPKSVDVSIKADSSITIQAVDYSAMFSGRQEYIPVPVNRQPALLGVEETVLEAALDGD